MQPFLCAALLCTMVLHTFAQLSHPMAAYLLSTFQAVIFYRSSHLEEKLSFSVDFVLQEVENVFMVTIAKDSGERYTSAINIDKGDKKDRKG